VIPFGEKRCDDPAGQMGLPRPRLLRRQPSRRQPLGTLHGVEPLEIAVLISIERDPQRPLGAVATGLAGQALDPGNESGIAPEAVELQLDQGSVREVGLGGRREHARRRTRRDTGNVIPVQDEHLATAPRQLVRHREADDAAADDDHLALGGQLAHWRPSLRRS
jgi:hypothetical protein